MTNRCQLLTEFIENPFFFLVHLRCNSICAICSCLLSSCIFDYVSIQYLQFAHCSYSWLYFWHSFKIFKGDLRVVIVCSMHLSAFASTNIQFRHAMSHHNACQSRVAISCLSIKPDLNDNIKV